MPVTRQKTSEEWIKILNAAGVPCGPIYTIDKTFADPQVKFLEMAQPVHPQTFGNLTIWAMLLAGMVSAIRCARQPRSWASIMRRSSPPSASPRKRSTT